MISTESLKHFQLLLHTAQVFQACRVHLFPYKLNLKKMSVEFVQRINYWRLIGVLNIFTLIFSMIIILLGILQWNNQGIPGIVIAIWMLTIFVTLLGCQIHLQIHYMEIRHWLNCVLLLNGSLSKFL